MSVCLVFSLILFRQAVLQVKPLQANKQILSCVMQGAPYTTPKWSTETGTSPLRRHTLQISCYSYKRGCLERLTTLKLRLLEDQGRRAQETYLGQLRTMTAWCTFLFCAQLCATGFFHSYAHIQTDEYKTQYSTYFTATEDSNERQLVSCTRWSTTTTCAVN